MRFRRDDVPPAGATDPQPDTESAAVPGREVRRRFLGGFLASLVIIVVPALIIGKLAARNALLELAGPCRTLISQQHTYLDGILARPYRHLQSLARKELETSGLLKRRDEEALQQVAAAFDTLLKRNPDYFQIRWIDARGVERVRLDQRREGEVHRASEDSLQDKADRPYVRAGLALPPGGLYVSPLDLNVEHGAVEVPFRPTVRLVTPVHDEDGAARGLVVLNVDASHILDRFRAFAGDTLTSLLNEQGHWLSSHHADDAWGFMFGRSDSFASRHPAVWARMRSERQGEEIGAEGLWTWRAVQALKADGLARGPEWIIVTHVAAETWQATLVRLWSLVALVALALVGLAGAIQWRLATSIVGERLARRALRKEAELLVRANAELVSEAEARRETAEELRAALVGGEAARQEADRANRAKSAFLANMSHEIRTPLNAIVGSSYLLGLTRTDDAQKQHVETIEVASRALLELINDVLDLSKIEAGEMRTEAVPFAPAALSAELRTLFDGVARRKGIGFSIDCLPEGMPEVVSGDVRKLRQILVNLVNNAIKFTERGGVRLACSLPGGGRRDEAAIRVRFEVVDTGPGIPPEVQGRLFAPFVQADDSSTRRHGGTGLGLSIVRHLAHLLGGRAGLHSRLGEGSTFWVELPLVPTDELPDRSADIIAEHPLRVLIAEDQAVDRQMLESMARAFCWEVDAVADGAALVDRVSALHARGTPVDCLIVDWRMPTLDGLAALRQIRARLPEEAMPGVVVVTAHDNAEFRRQGDALLPDAVLTKPVGPSALFNTVNLASCRHGRNLDHVLQRTRLEATNSLWLCGVQVLVVDDSPINLEVCRRVLEHQGAAVQTCESGSGALELLARSAVPVDAVLMDLQMPDMDGFEVTRRLRLEPRFKSLPVIALTAGALSGERKLALQAGMDDFLTKPIDPKAVIRVLRARVEKARGEPLPVLPGGASDGAASAPFPHIDGIDEVLASQRLMGDRALFVRLLGRFSKEHAESARELARLIGRRGHQELAALVHRLRGQAANIGAERLARSAEQLESAARTHPDGLAAAAQMFDQELARLLGALQAWEAGQAEGPALVPAPVVAEPGRLAEQLRRLHEQVARHAIAADELARRIALSLAGSALAPHFQSVVAHVEALDFAEADRALEAFTARAGAIGALSDEEEGRADVS